MLGNLRKGEERIMMKKFESFMEKYLTQLQNKMDNQVHLSAVKKLWLP